MSFFLPYQARIVRDRTRMILIEKARRVGVSWTLAGKRVMRAGVKGATNDAWISSRDETQAKLFINDANYFARSLHIGALDIGEVVIDEARNLSALTVALASGRRIYSMSSHPDAQAGKKGDRTLDEFALNKDNKALYSIAQAGMAWGGQLEICSTHRGSQNFFNKLIREIVEGGNPKKFSHHKITLESALAEGYLAKIKAVLPIDDPVQSMDEGAYFSHIEAGCADRETFLQEFCCIPDDDASAFIPWDWIIACEYPMHGVLGEAWMQSLANCGPLYIGWDIGRHRDLSVIVALEKKDDRFYTRVLWELDKIPYEDQQARLHSLLTLPNVVRCCIDDNGMGGPLSEKAAARFASKVEPYHFTNPSKEPLAYGLKHALEARNLYIPQSDAIRADFRSIRKTYTSHGAPRYDGDRTANGHADRFWAFALAIHAGSRPSGWVGLPVLIGESRISSFNDGWQNSISL